MKKLISYSAILLFTLGVYSCRESEEVIRPTFSENLLEAYVIYPIHSAAKDTVKNPNPPIKDGQDWRVVNKKE
ncbi:hypothetical protein Q73A0000_05830 [Kaistella flava (ex Peng et al. 2021)]|uniref:Uncharacterized protein n=1 Tax=Kaistella flava (ex Peng et al. 2021) TaxID=2038776 RepID=A0A7M2Y992_9FLAO|nr:hypothetical protein [Kaistella flava (ex Peng et al. 2021)]QOW09913.1 hypothetical protein Q73A0000_05830 [Kaistella flava (ex Peng et al. 2021)]